MKTMKESPQAALRRELGLPERVSRSSRPRVDDYFPFHCGNRVERKENPRHTGTVRAVIFGTVRVDWDNGWQEDLLPDGLAHNRSGVNRT